MNMEWIMALVTVILIVTGTAIVVILILHNKQDQTYAPTIRWNVELWSIRYGYRVNLLFSNCRTVGRYDLCGNESARVGAPLDTTISREHVLLYDQNGSIWAWNMSTVNSAKINGERLDVPRQIFPGQRLELGNSVYLITRVEICSNESVINY